MSEAAIALSYPEPYNKGRFLGFWLSFRLAGQVLGGAINLGINADRSEAGSVSYAVYLVFIALQSLGPFIGLLISKPENVQRTDGLKVKLSVDHSPWSELKSTARLFITKKYLLTIPFIAQGIYTEAVMFTFSSRKVNTFSGASETILITSSLVLSSCESPWLFSVRCCGYHFW
jgi:MFS family permease